MTKPNLSPVHYTLTADDPHAHLLRVRCAIADPDPTGETFLLPAWIPGSYLIRDFARHVVQIAARADDVPVPIIKSAKDAWIVRATPGSHTLEVEILVYAWDLSVRGAHFDTTHAFFNGSSVFLQVQGRAGTPCRLDIVRPAGGFAANWKVATALRRSDGDQDDFGCFIAANYAELIDHPVELGNFERIAFDTTGVAHEAVISGRHRGDLDRLRRDLKSICRWQLGFWGKPAPTDYYLFLITVVGDGYGGLEHRASTALMCSRDDLPRHGDASVNERYRTLLGLASHEYFHTWLVKRIMPAEFASLDLQRENPTELLWLFEGFTSYYDDLALLRSGVIGVADYLACLAKTIGNLLASPGRKRQSVAAASFDAWIKYYRPDENSPNSTVSYYTKGALVALLLDLKLREESDGRASLDDLMRTLWREFGRHRKGVREQDVRRIAEYLAGRKLTAFFARVVHSTAELDIASALRRFGVDMSPVDGCPVTLGVRLDSQETRITCAFSGGPAEAAGLAGGDVLIALDGLKVTPTNVESLLCRYQTGDEIEVHAFRHDELKRVTVRLAAAPPKNWSLTLLAKPARGVAERRRAWLGA